MTGGGGAPLRRPQRAPDAGVRTVQEHTDGTAAAGGGAVPDPAAAWASLHRHGAAYGRDGGPLRQWRGARREALLTAWIGRAPAGLVVDLGCGDGGAQAWVRRRGPGVAYVGVEPSGAAAGAPVPLVRGVAEALPLREGLAGTCLMLNMLDHCYDGEQALREAMRVVAPGGYLIICCDDDRSLYMRVRRLLDDRQARTAPDHLTRVSLRGTADLLRRLDGDHTWTVAEARSYGYLMLPRRLNGLLRRLPAPLLGALALAAERVGALVAPEGGTQFVVVGVKGTRRAGVAAR